jgi:hypothetical protein
MRSTTTLVSLLAVGLMGHGSIVLAHHSRANFQLDKLVELSGVVTEFNWANPHVYFRMKLDNGEIWLIEGHSVPGVLGLGWTPDTIKVGDQVRIGANPDRKTDKQFAMIQWVVAADGSVHPGFSRAQIPAELLAAAGSNPAPRGDARRVEPSTDFSGVWEVDLRGVNLVTGVFDPEPGLPLTAQGQRVLDTYADRENPSYQCISSGLPFTGPYGLKFTRYDDRLVMEKEHQDVQVTVWLDESAARDEPAGHLGFSIGHLEDEHTLVFETTRFTPAKWGVARGVDSSEMKRIKTRFELQPDGRAINFSYEITDPIYLTAPLIRKGVLLKQPDREFVDEPCDPKISSLHLTQE